MLPTDVLSLLNKKSRVNRKIKERLDRWRSLYYAISLHTLGAAPAFKPLNDFPLAYPAGMGSASSNYLVKSGWVYPVNFMGPEYQWLFDNFLLNRHPRESENTRWWRYSQYRAITKYPLSQISEVVVGAIFQESNYKVEMLDKEDNDYIWSNNFFGNTLVGYIANIGYREMIEDANGYFIVMPKYPFYEQREKRVELDVWFVHTKDMHYHTDDEMVFSYGAYAWHVDRNSIWRYRYDEDKKTYFLDEQDSQGYYAHLFGELPVVVAGGDWNTLGWYESFYNKAIPTCDDFIATYSAAQMTDKEASHPYLVEPSVECPDCKGARERTVTCETCPGGFVNEKCGTCHGTGEISRNPGQHLIMDVKDMRDGAKLYFVNPDVSINKLHRENIKELMERIIDSLHLTQVQQAQSGVAKAIDQERLFKFVSKIANHLFDNVIAKLLVYISAYRNATAKAGRLTPAQYPFIIVKPTQFQIKTSADLLNEYKEATSANMPLYVRSELISDFVEKQYVGDACLQRKSRYILDTDPISVATASEITILQSTPEEIQYHKLLPVWLDTIVANKNEEWFSRATDEQLKTEVDAMMKLAPPPVDPNEEINNKPKS